MHSSPRQSGNVLFLILIAVALFAALSYVVNNSSRTGSGGTLDEQGKMVASDFFSFGIEVRTAVQRMLLNGCTMEQINYSTSFFGTFFDNPNAPTDHHCDIFHKNGGGVAFRQIRVRDDYFATPFMTGDMSVVNLGTSEPELSLILYLQPTAGTTNVNTKVCDNVLKMNKLNINTQTQAEYLAAIGPYRGTFSSIGVIGDDVPALARQDIGCFSGGPGKWYNVYFVVSQR